MTNQLIATPKVIGIPNPQGRSNFSPFLLAIQPQTRAAESGTTHAIGPLAKNPNPMQTKKRYPAHLLRLPTPTSTRQASAAVIQKVRLISKVI